jgi:hypothetical protein
LPNWPDGVAAPSPELDGVVVDFRCVGSNNPNPMNVPGFGDILQNGRTVTHEVGHYLGLRHIWGDGGGIFGGSSCNADDGVDDTPNQGASSNYNCDPTQNTCDDEEDLDMIENYMDYSDQPCQNTFTVGQSAIMRAVLEGPRAGLIDKFSRIDENVKAPTWKVYPNPFEENIVLTAVDPLNSDTKGLKIYNLQGQVVRSASVKSIDGGDVLLDFSLLPAGTYLINWQGTTSKVVKK